MDSLANYGSDDDYDDSPDEKKTDWRATSSSSATSRKGGTNKQEDANYEEVQMDLSEESNGSGDYPVIKPNSNNSLEKAKDQSSWKDRRQSREREDRKRSSRDEESSCSSSGGRRREDRDRGDDYYRKDRDKDRDRQRRRDDDYRSESRDDYKRRDDDYRSDRDDYRRREDDKSERDRYRDDRKRSRRSSSKERQRSRSRSKSPRRPDYKSSRERTAKPNYSSAKKYERASNKMAHLEKLGIEIKTPDCQYVTPSDLQKSMDDQRRDRDREKEGSAGDKDRFFMPGITGRFRDQIEKRKLLWQKKEPEKRVERIVQETSTSSRGTKVWETVNFAQDQDGKVASKFKRLMGIKGQTDANTSTTDVLKKQEEMFSSMEQQYEVARTATHTMRGVGLGFGSFQR